MFRPPVVTILGHVDHGKTTLLDYIRKSRIAQAEHGAITQKIGAYEVKTDIKGYPTDKITLIDTPGHEAFSKLRSRGAQVADIALLIIDAKDSLKPQTVESISHIKATNIPFIVVLNKVDLPEANPEKVKTALLKHEVMVEEKGGKVPAISISAKTGKGVPELLETILLLASDIKLEFNPTATPLAYIIETKKDKRGIITTMIIKDGGFKIGDTIYADGMQTKIRAMVNDLGVNIKEAEPSKPFELLGFNSLPEVGTLVTNNPQEKKSAEAPKETAPFNLQAILNQTKEKQLSVIIKADTQGSIEAINASLDKEKSVNTVLAGVGSLNKSDIFLAKTTKSIVIGFNLKPDSEINELAKQEKVVIKTYNLIYELLDELTEVATLMRKKEENEKNLKGMAKVLATFIINNEKVYGVKITKGKANLGDEIELYREGELIGKAKLTSLKVRAKPVPEVKKDQEAGMYFSPELDIKVGDMVKYIL